MRPLDCCDPKVGAAVRRPSPFERSSWQIRAKYRTPPTRSAPAKTPAAVSLPPTDSPLFRRSQQIVRKLRHHKRIFARLLGQCDVTDLQVTLQTPNFAPSVDTAAMQNHSTFSSFEFQCTLTGFVGCVNWSCNPRLPIDSVPDGNRCVDAPDQRHQVLTLAQHQFVFGFDGGFD